MALLPFQKFFSKKEDEKWRQRDQGVTRSVTTILIWALSKTISEIDIFVSIYFVEDISQVFP